LKNFLVDKSVVLFEECIENDLIVFFVDHLALAEIQFLYNDVLLEFFFDQLIFFVDYTEESVSQKQVFGFFRPEQFCLFKDPLANEMRRL